MAKGRGKRTKNIGEQPATAESADTRPVEGDYPIDTGTAKLERDHYSPEGWVLKVNGVPSSHVDLAEPERLDFEYMRWIAALIRSRFAPAVFDGNESKLRALHLGGGACSMARWAAATYPNARQVVVELDGKLAELVRAWFDLPRARCCACAWGRPGMCFEA